MSQPHPHAILFDLDGTLVDTAPDFYGVVNSLRLEIGKSELPVDTIRKQVSNGGAALAELTWEISREQADFLDYRNRLLDRYADQLAVGSGLFAGFDAVLQELELIGIQWGIVTNKPRRFSVPLLQKLGIHTRSLICADDLSRAKPDPEGLLKCAAELGVEASACWYVGDHIRDIQAGKAAGMFAIGAEFGYIDDLDNPANWQADAYITQPADLITLLTRQPN
ncbi:HAD-IA family hydrolase [Oceanobacter mangrovi]|uniref:HAD-IA family hydrolase n=1 Tax=Oceanobacter mangrovi TaxID=2862510 RepID=UPI001C8D4123|nr:HAD-IA family hydrolase [Oceanobacter mangrovi]